MIQSWFPKDYFTFVGVGWFISTMMFLYLLTPALLALAGRIRRASHPAWIFLSCVAGLSGAAVLYCYLLRNTNMEYTQYVLPVARIWEYAIGICIGFLARLFQGRFAQARGTRALLFTVAEAAALALWIATPYFSDFPAWHYRIVRWLLPDILILAVFTVGEGYLSVLFRKRPLAALGNLSFECFLLHQIVLREYRKNANFKAPGPLNSAFSLAVCLLLTLLLANLIHRGKRPMPGKRQG